MAKSLFWFFRLRRSSKLSYSVLYKMLTKLLLTEIANDPANHGSMLVDVIGGSDKTIASVASGQQEFHPVYVSPGNISNTTRHGHGIGVLPIAFLPIPKGPQLTMSPFKLYTDAIF
jgi:hypothetical protein